MSSLLLALGLAALPAAVILFIFYRLDRARPEPIGLLARSVLYGFMAVVPVIVLELAFEAVVPPLPAVLQVLFESFLVAGLIEESVKLFFVRRYIFRRPEFDERVDGIVYAICVSLGFAFVENFLFGYNDVTVLFFRAFTAVPGHAVFSGLMGYYVGISKLEKGKEGAWKTGLAWAILLHGLYDALLLSASLASLLVLPLLFFGALALKRLWKRALAEDGRERSSRSYQSPLRPIV